MAIVTSIECTLPRPDIGELQAAIATELSKRLLGGAPTLPMSTEDVLAFVMAGAVNIMHGFVTQALKENNPASMCCDNLVIYGATHGVNLQATTRAKGYVAITGSPGAAIPGSLRFVGESSREYKLDPGVTFNPTTLDDNGNAVVRVVSALGGAAFNLPAGSALIVSTTFPGIDINGTVVGNGITNGTDNEDCNSLRVRIIAAEQAGVIATNQKWYLQQTARYPGITRVCADECEGCCDPQKVDLYPFMEGVYGDSATAPYGVPPCGVLDEMNDWMWGARIGMGEGLAPVGITGRYHKAIPTQIKVVAHCFRGCPEGVHDRMAAALRAYLRGAYCVGSKICKEHIRAEATRAAGVDRCFSDITLEHDGSARREDANYLYLDCAHFPVLEDVELRNTWS